MENLERQDRLRHSTARVSGSAKPLNGHSANTPKEVPPVPPLHPTLGSSDSGTDSLHSATTQDEVEKLRQMVKKLERQNRYLLKQHKQLIQQQKLLVLPPQDSSLYSTMSPDDVDRLSLLSHSTMVASTHAGATNDDASSILSASTSHQVMSSTPLPIPRESRSSHRKLTAPVSSSHKHSTPAAVADPATVNGKYAEDSWLYRVPKKSTATVDSCQETFPNAVDSPSKISSEKSAANQSTTISPVKWLREVFDSPHSLYTQTPARDSLLQKLDELRLTGRVSRWGSVSTLSYPSTPMNHTDSARSHLTFDYHSTNNATFSRPIIKASTFTPSRNSVGSLGSLAVLSNPTPLKPKEEVSAHHNEDTNPPAFNNLRREPLISTKNNIAMNDFLAMARLQQEQLKAQAHAVMQQQRKNSRSRSRPAQEERQSLPAQSTLHTASHYNTLPGNYH